MKAINRILHPTDFSEQADAALDHALDLAVRTGATLEVLHVIAADVTYRSWTDLPPRFESNLRHRLKEKTKAHLDALPPAARDALTIQYSLVGGAPTAPVLVEHLAQRPADLVVMGTHGRRGVRRLLLGSVAEAVLREAPCPVMVVRECRAGSPVAASSILAPIDFSEQSAEALGWARQLAALYEVPLTVLFVAEEHVVPYFSDTGLPSFTLLRLDREVLERAERALRQLMANTPGWDVPTNYLVHSGSPAHEIVTVANEMPGAMIVMATRGLAGLEQGLMGSVTDRVVRTASCPVFTLHAPLQPAPARPESAVQEKDEAHEGRAV